MMRVPPQRAQRGFSLIEVLVSLIIIAFGMLGLAKLQALTYSSTGISAMRSIAAIQASSLAATMHANRSYWSVVANGWSYTFAGTTATPTATDSAVSTSANTCRTAICTTTQIAALDLSTWRTSVINALPAPTATVTCSSVSPNPVTCTIQLLWVEGTLSANASSNGNAMVGASTVPYILYVVP